nr:MAG TPA: hypothetical protein [Caudoviricetes sp.]
MIYKYLYLKHIFYYGNTPHPITLKARIKALYIYYTPILILLKNS